MNLHPLGEAPNFDRYSLLELNEKGRFVDYRDDKTQFEIESSGLYSYFQRRIRLPVGVTDVFVWVHGWQHDLISAQETARKLFQGIEDEMGAAGKKYPHLNSFTPWYVAV